MLRPALLLVVAACLTPACVTEELGPQPPSWQLITDEPLIAVAQDPSRPPPRQVAAPEPSVLDLIADDPATAEDLDPVTSAPIDETTEFHRLGRDVIRGLDGTWTKMYTVRSGRSADVVSLLKAYVPDFPEAVDVWNLDDSLPHSRRIKYSVLNNFYKDETTDKLGRREPVKSANIADVIHLTAPPPVLLFVDELLAKVLADLPQIEIQILVVEVNLSDEIDFDSKVKLARLANRDLPFDELTNPTQGNFGAGIPILDGNGPEGLGAGFSSFPDGDISLPGFLLSLQGVHNHLNVDGIISLLQTIGASELLVTPKITVLNGHRASLTTGDKLPVFETKGTVNNPSVSTSFEPTGVTIEMIPFIMSEDLIRIDLSIDVSQQTGSQPFVLNGVDVSSPIISQRTAGTTLHVYSDQTFTLGGLKSNRQIETLTKVPFLGDIPLIGWFFKSRNSTKQTTEILFFVRPSIKVPSQTLLDPIGS